MPNYLCHFAFPPATDENFCCSMSYPKFGVVSVLGFHQSYWCVEIIISPSFNLQFFNDKMILNIFIFYITSRYPFLYFILFSTCISSFVKCLLSSLTHFLIESVYFLIVDFLRDFVYIGQQSFIRCVFCKMSPLVSACLQSLLTLSVTEHNF